MAPRVKAERKVKTEEVTRKPLSVPTSASWYFPGAVNPYERDALSKFGTIKALGGESNYMGVREFMVNTSRQRPGVFLAATACRRALAVHDALAVVRVHSFLEDEGLINAAISVEARPVPFAPLVRILGTLKGGRMQGGERDECSSLRLVGAVGFAPLC